MNRTVSDFDRLAYRAGWRSSRDSVTLDLDAAEARFDRKHPGQDVNNMFSAGWVDYAADRPYGWTLDTER